MIHDSSCPAGRKADLPRTIQLCPHNVNGCTSRLGVAFVYACTRARSRRRSRATILRLGLRMNLQTRIFKHESRSNTCCTANTARQDIPANHNRVKQPGESYDTDEYEHWQKKLLTFMSRVVPSSLERKRYAKKTPLSFDIAQFSALLVPATCNMKV